MATNPLISRLVSEIDRSNGVDLFSSKKRMKQDDFSSTGISALDVNLNTFGIPCGITEVQGPSQSGKTTFSYACMKRHQIQWGEQAVCIVLSSERRDNMPYAKRIGVDVDNVIVIKSVYLEDLMYKVELKLREVYKVFGEAKIKPKVMVIWDSVSATLSRSETAVFEDNLKSVAKSMEKGTKLEIKHAQPGAFAKQGKMHLKAILGNLYDNDVKLICINHTMEDFETGKMDSGGGTAFKYLATLRLMLRNKENIKLSDDGDIVAQKTLIMPVKNDFGPKKPTMAELLHGIGFVLSQEDIDYAVEKGILVQESAKKISFMNGKLSWISKRTLYQLYYDGNKLLDILHKKIDKARYAELEERLNSLEDGEEIEETDEDDDEEVVQAAKTAVVSKNRTILKKPQIVLRKKS